MTAEVVIRLACGHLRLDAPDHGTGELMCGRCREPQRILERITGWSLSCACGYGRRYGLGELECKLAADRHSRKYPGHVVRVKLGKKVVSIATRKLSQPELPFGADDPPPF